MSLPTIHPAAFSPMPDAVGRAAALREPAPAGFAADLDAAVAADRTGDRAAEARQVAEQLVSTTFIEPVLALLREANQAAGPFAPSSTERRFTPFLDQHLAERIVRGANFPLVDRITEDLLLANRAGAELPAVEDHDHAST